MDDVETRRRVMAFFAVAAAIAGGALWAVTVVIADYDAAIAEALAPKRGVPVVVASRTLHRGVPITAEDLFVVEVSLEALPRVVDEDGRWVQLPVFSSRERLIGLHPREPVLAGELIRPERLADGRRGIGLHAMLPRGFRALSIDLAGPRALDGLLEPGSFVDILVSWDVGDDRRATQTLLQAVFVMATHGRALGDAEGESSAVGSHRPSVTLMVTGEQAEDVALASEIGEVTLTLRGARDVGYEPLRGATLDDLVFRLARSPVPDRPRVEAPARSSTVLIRGPLRELILHAEGG